MISIKSVYLECFHSLLYAALALGYNNCRFYIFYMAFIDEIESLITLHTFLPGLCKQTYFEFTQHSFLNANKGSEFPNMSFPSMEGSRCPYSQLQTPDRPIILLLSPCSVPAVTACYKEKVVNSSHSFSHFTVHRSWWKMELFSSPFLCQLK